MNNVPSEPLVFAPIFRDYLWGGRRLESLLGKQLPADGVVAESWELVDHGKDQSRVLSGPWQDWTLNQLVREFPRELVGRESQDRFPLLLKYLDCQQSLSIQVHPNDSQAALLDPPDLGKTEAWVVLHAEPGSRIYAGLQPGLNQEQLSALLAAGEAEQALAWLEPAPGDCLLIPAGTVHALGAGLVIVEIQQASDTTFRLDDWNRLDDQGQPRQLHRKQGLAVVDFQSGPCSLQLPQATSNEHVENLVDCPQFQLDRIQLRQPMTLPGQPTFQILTVLDGEVAVEGNPGITLTTGQTCLLPASCGDRQLTPLAASVLLSSRS
jgi:mannose-6-phosphate isomerase